MRSLRNELALTKGILTSACRQKSYGSAGLTKGAADLTKGI